jgi:hypothetical protein
MWNARVERAFDRSMPGKAPFHLIAHSSIVAESVAVSCDADEAVASSVVVAVVASAELLVVSTTSGGTASYGVCPMSAVNAVAF